MATTPAAAVTQHMAAINSRDPERVNATLSFPFVQIWPDGAKSYAEEPGQSLTGGRALPDNWARTDIDRLELVDTTGELSIYRLTFTRYDTSGEPTLGTHQGLWAVSRVDGEWKVSWRQYLGAV